jgi:hypothetical protein
MPLTVGRFNSWQVIPGADSKLIALMDDNSTPSIAIACNSALGAYSFSLRVIDRRDVVAAGEEGELLSLLGLGGLRPGSGIYGSSAV